MKFCLIIPIYNEAKYLFDLLDSLVKQSHLPEKIILVDDYSKDASLSIVQEYAKMYDFIQVTQTKKNKKGKQRHQPGARVVNNFYTGFTSLKNDYDVICKFDADLIFPLDYLERINQEFESNPKLGMCGGLLQIEKNGDWIYEDIAKKSHLRGPIKAYRKDCFKDISGLRKGLGWDTADVLLADMNGWEVKILDNLWVRHLKPTGALYQKDKGHLLGLGFHHLRYDFFLSLAAGLKAGYRAGSFQIPLDALQSWRSAKSKPLVSKKEGAFIRKSKWKGMLPF